MAPPVDLYNTSYDQFSARAQQLVRAETYGEDIGQSSWMTADELRQFILFLGLTNSDVLLEVGSGSGGPALFVAEAVGCRVVGVDVNEFGIKNANELARSRKLDSRVEFHRVDASRPLPFATNQFDAIISNDAMCHIPGRVEVLREWGRVMKPGGKMLFTDALVVSGLVSHEEIARRSSIGYYFYVPPGENEKLIEEAGFDLLGREDLTLAAANVSQRWHQARERHRQDLVRVEGEGNFAGLQGFLWTVHTLCRERRLSRWMYLARKPGADKARPG